MLIPRHRVLLGCSLEQKNNGIYLCHVGDVFLSVLVRVRLLLHLVSQFGQRLEQGNSFPLGLMNVNETQRRERWSGARHGQRKKKNGGRDEEERKRNRAVVARRKRKR